MPEATSDRATCEMSIIHPVRNDQHLESSGDAAMDSRDPTSRGVERLAHISQDPNPAHLPPGSLRVHTGADERTFYLNCRDIGNVSRFVIRQPLLRSQLLHASRVHEKSRRSSARHGHLQNQNGASEGGADDGLRERCPRGRLCAVVRVQGG